MIKGGRADAVERYENKNEISVSQNFIFTEVKEGFTFKTLEHFLT